MNDLELLQSCLKANKQGWAEFILRYSRLIYNYIHSVLTIKGKTASNEQIEDIFQGLFQSLLKDNCKKLTSFQGKNGCTLASWLRQVTVNFTIDYLRRIKPSVSMDAENEEGFSLADTLADPGAPAVEFINDQEKRKALSECIGLLERAEQFFLELLLNQGLSLEEIREYLKINRGAVDMRKSRIMQKLQECFKNKGFFG